MKLELKEHELERVIEVYLQLQFKKEVRVSGFDLSGMRSKDGLSAMVDFTLVGESDVREPREVSINVNPTNTSWRAQKEDKEDTEKHPELEDKDLEDWSKFLGLLADNARYHNYDAIMDLVDNTSDLVRERINANELFKEMCSAVEQQVSEVAGVINKPEEEPLTGYPTKPIEEKEEPSFVETLDEVDETPSENEPKEEIPADKEIHSVGGKNIFGSPLGTKPVNVHNATPRKLFK